MIIYTIGFSKKSLEQFVNLLRESNITKLVDIRLKSNSQLSGWAKARDLRYFLENYINIKYEYILEFAPTKGILEKYRKDHNWKEYEKDFNKLLESRNLESIVSKLINQNEKICFLCSEPKAKRCHRRLVAEFIKKNNPNTNIKHI